MQKVLWVIGVCALGAFVSWKSVKSNPRVDELLLKNVEALANLEDIYKPPTPPTLCDGTGNLTCPKIGVKVEYVVQGYSLQPDEETY